LSAAPEVSVAQHAIELGIACYLGPDSDDLALIAAVAMGIRRYTMVKTRRAIFRHLRISDIASPESSDLKQHMVASIDSLEPRLSAHHRVELRSHERLRSVSPAAAIRTSPVRSPSSKRPSESAAFSG